MTAEKFAERKALQEDIERLERCLEQRGLTIHTNQSSWFRRMDAQAISRAREWTLPQLRARLAELSR